MQHCDPEALSLIALGEPASAAERAHLDGCVSCRQELARLREVVDVVRVPIPAGDALPPPPQVWAAIAAATAAENSGGVRSPAAVEGVAAANPPADAAAPVLALRRPRTPSQSRRTLLAVAASALLLGGAAGSAVTWQLAPRPEPAAQAIVLRTASLGPLPSAPAGPAATPPHGTATVVQTADGPRLSVDVTSLGPLRGEFYEVWLIDRTVKRMVPVGILTGATGQFAIPAGLDLADYAVVDISVQHPGDPRHSGNSVLRGTIAL